MQFYKGILLLGITSLFLACGNKSENKGSVKEKKGVEIVSSKLFEYSLNDTTVINAVDAVVFNNDSARNYDFVVTLYQDDKNWVDTTTFYAKENDTARFQVIFGESLFNNEQPASFSAKLYPVKM